MFDDYIIILLKISHFTKFSYTITADSNLTINIFHLYIFGINYSNKPEIGDDMKSLWWIF